MGLEEFQKYLVICPCHIQQLLNLNTLTINPKVVEYLRLCHVGWQNCSVGNRKVI